LKLTLLGKKEKVHTVKSIRGSELYSSMKYFYTQDDIRLTDFTRFAT